MLSYTRGSAKARAAYSRHAAVCPEMLREIQASGRRNYSLFLREDGLLTGYFETETLEASTAYLNASPTAARWEAEMALFFESIDGRPDQGFRQLPEIFNLHDQLASTKTINTGDDQYCDDQYCDD